MTWWKWLGIGAAAGGLAVYFLLPRQVETRTVIQEVIKWKTVERIKTMPGAVTTLRPDGTTVISGPVEIGRESEGSTSRHIDSSVVPTRVRAWTVLVGAGVLLPPLGYEVSLAANLWGGRVVGFGPYVKAQWELGRPWPSRWAVGLGITF